MNSVTAKQARQHRIDRAVINHRRELVATKLKRQGYRSAWILAASPALVTRMYLADGKTWRKLAERYG